MTWARVDDKLYSSPKWLATSKGGRALWVTALSWSMDHLTDGAVPKYALPMLGATTRDANDLVRTGLWEADTAGYLFHDWSDYQPDAASIKSKREAESEAGKRGNHNRWHAKRGIVVAGCEWCESEGGSGVRSGTRSGKGESGPESSRPRTHTPTNSSKRDTGTPRNAREHDEPEPHPQAEFDAKKLLASAGLAQTELRDFLVDLKAGPSPIHNTTAFINALHRDGKLRGRIVEWRSERDLAAEASARPKAGKRTTDDKVADGFALAEEFRAMEAGANPNVIPLRQIEGA